MRERQRKSIHGRKARAIEPHRIAAVAMDRIRTLLSRTQRGEEMGAGATTRDLVARGNVLGRGLPPVYERRPVDAPAPEGRTPHWRFKLDHDRPIAWIDLIRGELTVRDGKGRKDRVTVLPMRLAGPLRSHLSRVRLQHESDRAAVCWPSGCACAASTSLSTLAYPPAVCNEQAITQPAKESTVLPRALDWNTRPWLPAPAALPSRKTIG